MTETQQNPTDTPEAPAAAAAPPPEVDSDSATGYAVYDETELRFRGRVHATKGEANSAKSDIAKTLPKGKAKHRLTVRAV